jgi:hypothetical protein
MELQLAHYFFINVMTIRFAQWSTSKNLRYEQIPKRYSMKNGIPIAQFNTKHMPIHALWSKVRAVSSTQHLSQSILR